jgi:hypothetical protein
MNSANSTVNLNGETDGQEDESGFERDLDRESEIEVPFDPRKIDIVNRPMTVSMLHSRLEMHELDLTPEFQRQANVWDAKRKSRLIESILLRIPLPSFYFSEDEEGVYAVVDGLQRLCAVFHFVDFIALNNATGAKLASLRLTGLQYLRDLEGATFADLDRKYQRRITEHEVSTNIIRAGTPSAVKFNVFARLNQGGMPLNAQEIRNAIFPGAWRRHIAELTSSPIFLEATEGKVRTTRQQDMELVLRYIALWQLGPLFLRPPGQTLDEFLNNTVEHVFSKWTTADWSRVTDAFLRALVSAKQIFGPFAFRKVGPGSRKPINRGLFEAELIILTLLTPEQIAQAVDKSELVLHKLSEALQSNTQFIQALLYGTGSPDASNIRILTLASIFKEVLDA